MHSRWQIWDFFSSYNRDTLKTYEGILALNTFDPFCLKLVKDFLTRGLGDDKPLHYKVSQELTLDWIQEEFQTLSLFGNNESYFIHEAQEIDTKILDTLTSSDVSGRFVILSFENEITTWKKLVKDGKVDTLVIEAPRFWELNKLLDFVCQYLRLPLSYQAKNWILDALENNLGTFYNSCGLIKLNYPDAKEVSLDQVKELLTLERLDQFQLASMFARKKNREFYNKLTELEGDFDKMKDFFRFMQSHLIKLMDTSYLAQKSRLTQYDKDLQGTAKFWKEQEIADQIQIFNSWEILAKRKDSHLWHELKEAHLKAMTPLQS